MSQYIIKYIILLVCFRIPHSIVWEAEFIWDAYIITNVFKFSLLEVSSIFISFSVPFPFRSYTAHNFSNRQETCWDTCLWLYKLWVFRSIHVTSLPFYKAIALMGSNFSLRTSFVRYPFWLTSLSLCVIWVEDKVIFSSNSKKYNPGIKSVS